MLSQCRGRLIVQQQIHAGGRIEIARLPVHHRLGGSMVPPAGVSTLFLFWVSTTAISVYRRQPFPFSTTAISVLFSFSYIVVVIRSRPPAFDTRYMYIKYTCWRRGAVMRRRARLRARIRPPRLREVLERRRVVRQVTVYAASRVEIISVDRFHAGCVYINSCCNLVQSLTSH